MRLAKSLLLGELLKADVVDYEDVCENRFWIVCPVCAEPVFKVVRNSANEIPATHYFSHYEAHKAYAADCELRVRRITEREVANLAEESRGQKLRFFVSVFDRMVRDTFNSSFPNTPRWTRNGFKALKRSAAVAELRKMTYVTLIVNQVAASTDDELLIAFDEAIQKLTASELTALTSRFSIYTQKRIALDVLRYVASPQGDAAFETLFLYAFAWEQELLEKAVYAASILAGTSGRGSVQQAALSFMKQLVSARTSELKPLTLLHGSEFFTSLMSAIQMEVFLILLRLPYIEKLRDAITKKTDQAGNTSKR